MPKVIEVICMEEKLGNGTNESPYRQGFSYWTLQGTFLAEYDELKQLPEKNQTSSQHEEKK